MKYTPQELGLTRPAYSVGETIKITKSSRAKLYENIKAGKLRMIKNGRQSIFLAPDIAEFLSNLPNSGTV
jgi:hypothetical protein